MAGERVLVVDDSAQMRDFLAKVVLRSEDVLVETAVDGEDGLAVALKNPPDLIISDYAMPGMTGLQMVEELRDVGQETPVILITGEGSEDVAAQALRLGVLDYFVKPLDPLALVNSMKEILQSQNHVDDDGEIRRQTPDPLNVLISISRLLASDAQAETIYRRIVDAAVYLSGAEEGSLMLVDNRTGDLRKVASTNPGSDVQGTALPVADQLVLKVLQTGEPLFVEGHGLQTVYTGRLVRSLMYVPVRFQGDVIGVLDIHNRLSDESLSREIAGILSALADLAAVASALTSRNFEG